MRCRFDGVGLLSVAAALYASPASAEEACTSPYSRGTWVKAMDDAEAKIKEGDVDGGGALLDAAHAQVPCLRVPARPADLARFANLKAWTVFLGADEMAATGWLNLARAVSADTPLPAFIPETHPVRLLLDGVDAPASGGPEGKGLAAPKKGYGFVNGVAVAGPKALVDVPNLVQLFDAKGTRTAGAWIEGAAFPDPLVIAGGEALDTAPKWYDPANPPADAEILVAGAGPAGGDAEPAAAVGPEGPLAPIGCAVATPAGEFAGSLSQVLNGLVMHDAAVFSRARALVDRQQACVGEPLGVGDVASLHRLRGLLAAFEGKTDLAVAAFAAARRIDPDYRFPESVVPANHAITALYLDAAALAGAKAEPVAHPRAGWDVLIDGQSSGERAIGVATYVQVVAPDGRVWRSQWLGPKDPLPLIPAGSTKVP